LQELAGDVTVGRFVSGHKKFFWHATRDTFGLRIDQKIFLFDPEPEIVHHPHRPFACRRPRDPTPIWSKLLKKRG
jgi:hypothetical protein